MSFTRSKLLFVVSACIFPGFVLHLFSSGHHQTNPDHDGGGRHRGVAGRPAQVPLRVHTQPLRQDMGPQQEGPEATHSPGKYRPFFLFAHLTSKLETN